MFPSLFLKKGKEKLSNSRHPWIFSGALQDFSKSAREPGLVSLYDANQKLIGYGFFHPTSQISIRMLCYCDQQMDMAGIEELIQQRIADAWKLRQQSFSPFPQAYRLVNAEGDGLPGLIVDVYNKVIVLRFSAKGMWLHRTWLLQVLKELLQPEAILEHNDGDVAKKEGLPSEICHHLGAPDRLLQIEEHNLLFQVDLRGQKSGFFLDQRENRFLARRWAHGRDVLDACSYSGGFALNALAAGAKSVCAVDIDSQAIALARENLQCNPALSSDRICFQVADIFTFLREQERDLYDFIILDPPKFARRRQEVEKAARGYKDINWNAMKLLRPGGYLMTFSCSQAMDAPLFQKVLFAAAQDAHRQVQILRHLRADMDHVTSLYHPEGEYLKGFLLRVF